MLAWSWFVLSAVPASTCIPWLKPVAAVACGIAVWTSLLLLVCSSVRALHGKRRRAKRKRHSGELDYFEQRSRAS